jgi:hypothetical protein
MCRFKSSIYSAYPLIVMAALVAAIHTLPARRSSWMAGTSPAMTEKKAGIQRYGELPVQNSK